MFAQAYANLKLGRSQFQKVSSGLLFNGSQKVSEKPIIFSDPMVQAILDGRKSQTRRIIKWQASSQSLTPIQRVFDPIAGMFGMDIQVGSHEPNLERMSLACPYGMPGDALWVREAWGIHSRHTDEIPPQKRSELPRPLDIDRTKWAHHYRADGNLESAWYPSIHMPRWASRITLEIVDVRVERLQDISDENIYAEGLDYAKGSEGEWGNEFAQEEFQQIWESINGAGSWDANPFTWVVEFRKRDD